MKLTESPTTVHLREYEIIFAKISLNVWISSLIYTTQALICESYKISLGQTEKHHTPVALITNFAAFKHLNLAFLFTFKLSVLDNIRLLSD